MNVYPIFLNDLAGRRCVVFGGNHEAERKVRELLDLGADVVLIAPAPEARLRALAEDGRLTWHARAYVPGDLQGAFLAIVAERNPEATAPIYREAQAEKVLINAMDDVPHCTFVAGSVVRQGALTIAISTAGAAPALSVRLRERFEQAFGPEYAAFLDLMRALRAPMATRYPDFEERRRRWYALVDGDVLALLRAGRREEALDRIEALTGLRVPERETAPER
ncbi:bifunctional precorrin-2 dehydrogenase/sirohydrochlorin ferrochelatase [Rhodocaloribacter litoris]|uniref:precorrin-2 dehydrogenase/sirohydrochlorin ferrochelatase family protein n=1 Tax=Rhodocaloribacter litoris TaxID=2558931 RepID=UPI001420B7E2|nr:bifunctional precorrin-2 dehydrogenase/sirohydrochlorin ferrochelatase [Rhodocaloribacter litoris]QXD16242.1 bifunctional precorrin-2 dehydrogenase/sirohydrochlorin ferrochelatase [Rhodocaloribacter litoris]GIV60736.1 MAG: precorrin-2 dehydrogenase [Rhodothermaceae bacterium]